MNMSKEGRVKIREMYKEAEWIVKDIPRSRPEAVVKDCLQIIPLLLNALDEMGEERDKCEKMLLTMGEKLDCYRYRAEALERAIRSCPSGICHICANCKNKIEYCPDCINSDNWSNWVFDEARFAGGGESGE